VKKPNNSEELSVYKNRKKAFSLLELLIVLGLIGGLASLVLGRANLTSSSRIGQALTEVTGLIKGSFDEAVITGRMIRLNLDLSTSQYWVEFAPDSFHQRIKFVDETDRRMLPSYEQLQTEYERSRRRMTTREEQYYTVRSFLIQQRHVFQTIAWQKGEDPTIFGKKKLPGDLVFSRFQTETMSEAVIRDNNALEQIVSTYFFPSSECIPTAIYLVEATDQPDQFTLISDPYTGKVKIEEGIKTLPFSTRD
jgi:prepilin-type N-terminal cleavage/methylation domain-containing protein